jgi:hypothetical protein
MTLTEVTDSLPFRTKAEVELTKASESALSAAVESETAAGVEVETPLMLFIGVSNQAYLFTSHRLLILKKIKPLVRLMNGRMMTDFTAVLSGETLTDLLANAAVTERIALREVNWLDAERMYRVGAVTVFVKGRRYELTIGHKRAEIAPYVSRLREHWQIPSGNAQVALQRELKFWAWFYLVTGVLTALMSGMYPGMLDAAWGTVMALIGAGVMFRRNARMLLLLSLMMGWAGLTNLLGLNSSLLSSNHLPLGVIFQFYWAMVLMTRYRRYAHLDSADVSESNQCVSDSSTPSFRQHISPELLLSVAIPVMQIAALGFSLLTAERNIVLMRLLMHLTALGAAVGAMAWMNLNAQEWRNCAASVRRAVSGVVIMNALMTLSYIAFFLMAKQHT